MMARRAARLDPSPWAEVGSRSFTSSFDRQRRQRELPGVGKGDRKGSSGEWAAGAWNHQRGSWRRPDSGTQACDAGGSVDGSGAQALWRNRAVRWLVLAIGKCFQALRRGEPALAACIRSRPCFAPLAIGSNREHRSRKASLVEVSGARTTEAPAAGAPALACTWNH